MNQCDSRDCSALAKVRWVSPSGFDLLLCLHHGRRHNAPLVEAGWQKYILVRACASA